MTKSTRSTQGTQSKLLTQLESYNYKLPKELIASYPYPKRDACRLLHFESETKYNNVITKKLYDKKFTDLKDIFKEGDLLILNNTRVSHRRVELQRSNGNKLTVLFLEPLEGQKWSCLLAGKRKLKINERLFLSAIQKYSEKKIEFIFLKTPPKVKQSYLLPVLGGSEIPAWNSIIDAEYFFNQYGEPPLPPYLKREASRFDEKFYQTVYANKKAKSVAAPTAGLHFSQALLEEIQTKGVQIENIELEIGYGTFTPLQKENFFQNRLHKENYYLTDHLAKILNKKRNKRVIAVGTTTLRALETNFQDNKGKFVSGQFTTNLFLKPPDHVYTTDGLLTNFHLPASSLLLLVAAYLGNNIPNILEIYQHAIKNKYLFFSYGDAMLIFRNKNKPLYKQ